LSKNFRRKDHWEAIKHAPGSDGAQSWTTGPGLSVREPGVKNRYIPGMYNTVGDVSAPYTPQAKASLSVNPGFLNADDRLRLKKLWRFDDETLNKYSVESVQVFPHSSPYVVPANNSFLDGISDRHGRVGVPHCPFTFPAGTSQHEDSQQSSGDVPTATGSPDVASINIDSSAYVLAEWTFRRKV
jgi:hypothetical protein